MNMSANMRDWTAEDWAAYTRQQAITALVGEDNALSDSKDTLLDELLHVTVKRYYQIGKHKKNDILVLGDTRRLKDSLTACGFTYDLDAVKLAAIHFIQYNAAFVDFYAEPVYPMQLGELLSQIKIGNIQENLRCES